MTNPNYTVNFGVDPLLQNPYSPNNIDYEREIEDRMRKLQAMKEQYSQVKQYTAGNSLWTEIDREVSSLNAQYHDNVVLYEKWFGNISEDEMKEKIIEATVVNWFEDIDAGDDKVWEYFKAI